MVMMAEPAPTASVEYDTNNVISTLKSAGKIISDNKELTSLLAMAVHHQSNRSRFIGCYNWCNCIKNSYAKQ